ncbi:MULTISPECIES: hypothetical protein [Marinobacter]|uniref:hypothetical protein n=1 Tax=Marinobacter TaxID=2742 RepID=UPI0016771F93|nr:MULTISPECIES: hypothetical protein [Marinobacter]MEC8898510.1 hypothetical protein [Pseudomonadota bacterium]MEC9386956.1 hypothetical protein [Pseudomonadota bacterium]
MAEKTFQQMCEETHDAFEEHMTGEYSAEKRERWIEKRDECDAEYWRLLSGGADPEDS